MNRTLKIISTVLIGISLVVGFYRMLNAVRVMIMYSPLLGMFDFVGVLMVCVSGILLVVGMWKDSETLKIIAYALYILHCLEGFLEYFFYLGTRMFTAEAIDFYITYGAMVLIGILLIVSRKKCGIPFIIAISVLSVILGASLRAGLWFLVPVSVAGLLCNIAGETKKAPKSTLRKSIWGEMSMLKSQYDEGVISEEEYTERKGKLLNEF